LTSTAAPELVLASASPRRCDILHALGLTFSVQSISIDERPRAGELPQELVVRLAIQKAAAATVLGHFAVLGSDTIVVLDDSILGKPRDRHDGVDMLLRLSGRSHLVLTAVALRTNEGTATALASTKVQFRDINRDEATRYWHSGEPRDKAGGYGIQGMGGMFVAAINGSFSAVMGLPVFETAALLRAVGIEVVKHKSDQL